LKEVQNGTDDIQTAFNNAVASESASIAQPVIQRKPGRRGAVSAESMDPSALSSTPRKVVKKSTEEIFRINVALDKNLLFRNLADDQRSEVIDAMFEVKVAKGVSVIKQGEDGDNFYVIDEGQFDIYVNGSKVSVVTSGGCFGELALMYNCPRAATVTATVDSVLWAVDRVTFQKTIMNNTFRKRKLYEKFVVSVPILKDLSKEELGKVVDALEPETYVEDDVIIEQGEAGNSFYLMVKGDCVVTKTENNTKQEVGKLKQGDYFGELALLTDSPRAATVTALGDVECVVLDVHAFNRLLGPCKDVLKRNAGAYKQYEQKLEKEGMRMTNFPSSS